MSSTPPLPASSPVTSFRTKLFVGMMLVITGITAIALYFAQRNVAEDVERDLQREFQGELAALHRVQEIRHAALVERCRPLVRRARIQGALEEDGALDLLYPSAKDELRDMMRQVNEPSAAPAYSLHAEFYRFLDGNGKLISLGLTADAGRLQPEEERQLALATLSQEQQLGYIVRSPGAEETISEVIAMPIISNHTGQAIGALVFGFPPVRLVEFRPAAAGIKRGVWMLGKLHLTALSADEQATLNTEMTRALATDGEGIERGFGGELQGKPHRFFFKRLNPNSPFPPAYEVCIYPLTEMAVRLRQLRWQVSGVGALLLLCGLIASQVVSQRLSVPVEKLAVDSADNLAQRQRAEAALELTSGELQRAARFSADASHQLKTPVAVLRAGLEELLAQENLTPEECADISALIHQTYRLSSVIEDLLLLSRMDAGRLKIEFSPVNLTQLIEASLDDLSALPDVHNLEITTDFPSTLHVSGEKRYLTLILQNLLENAQKYNRAGGRIRIVAAERGDWVFLTVSNTGKPIPATAQTHIFERFHRGAMGENVPGYGLGLNLSRELARLHQGDVRLVRSDEVWTEFEVRLCPARPAPVSEGTPA